MRTLAKITLLFSISVPVMLYANSAISQMENDQTPPSPRPYAEQDYRRVPSPETREPASPAPASPVVSPTESNQIPLQQTLLSSSTIVGVAVNNAQGEKMGTIREIMIDPMSGQAVYAVVDSTSAFGIGKQKSFAVPWHALRMKLDQTEIVAQLEQGQFPMQPSVALSQR